jgi:hypothetical protein
MKSCDPNIVQGCKAVLAWPGSWHSSGLPIPQQPPEAHLHDQRAKDGHCAEVASAHRALRAPAAHCGDLVAVTTHLWHTESPAWVASKGQSSCSRTRNPRVCAHARLRPLALIPGAARASWPGDGAPGHLRAAAGGGAPGRPVRAGVLAGEGDRGRVARAAPPRAPARPPCPGARCRPVERSAEHPKGGASGAVVTAASAGAYARCVARAAPSSRGARRRRGAQPRARAGGAAERLGQQPDCARAARQRRRRAGVRAAPPGAALGPRLRACGARPPCTSAAADCWRLCNRASMPQPPT